MNLWWSTLCDFSFDHPDYLLRIILKFLIPFSVRLMPSWSLMWNSPSKKWCCCTIAISVLSIHVVRILAAILSNCVVRRRCRYMYSSLRMRIWATMKGISKSKCMGGFAREEPLAVSGSSSQSHSGIAQEYQSTAVMQILDGLLWISKDSDNWPPCPLRLIRLVGFEYQLLTKRHIHAFTTDWYRWYRRTFYSMSSKAFSIEHITSCISSLSVCSSERLTHMRQTLS